MKEINGVPGVSKSTKKKVSKSKKEKMTKVKEVKVSKFEAKVLALLNKDEKTVQAEAVKDKIEDFVFNTKSQITQLDNISINEAEIELSRAERNLTNVIKANKNVYLDIMSKSFDDYINAINESNEEISNAEHKVFSLKSAIEDLKAQSDMYKEILKKLES